MTTPEKNSERLPPHSIEAEQGLLGSCIIEGGEENLALLAERMIGRDGLFYDLRHANLWQHVAAMARHAMPVDQFTILQRLKVGDCEDDVGGLDYLFELCEKIPTTLNFDYFWAECLELWKLRRQLATATAAIREIYDNEKPAAEILEAVEARILASGDNQDESTIKTGRDIMLAAADELNGYIKGVGLKRGLGTGIEYYDKMTTGFYGKEYIVLAGRPGTGKTSLALDWIDHICVEGKTPTLFFSLEMTHDQLAHRFYCQRGRVDFQRLRTGFMVDADMRKITIASAAIAAAPLFVDDKSAANILEIRSKARRYKRLHDIGFIVIDYMQLISPPPTSDRFANRADQMSEISQHILAMAKELDIPVLVLAQLNRDVEKTDRPRAPRLSDLKESGQIEQDAHNVTILHEPLPKSLSPEEVEMLESDDWSRTRKRVNARICKQRNGPTGDCAMTFWKHCMHFTGFKQSEARAHVRGEKWVSEGDQE